MSGPPTQSIIKSPLSILSPRWSGFFILVMGSMGLVISFGGSGLEMLAERGRVAFEAKGLPDEKDGDRLVLSRMASDQLNPSPVQRQCPVLQKCSG